MVLCKNCVGGVAAQVVRPSGVGRSFLRDLCFVGAVRTSSRVCHRSENIVLTTVYLYAGTNLLRRRFCRANSNRTSILFTHSEYRSPEVGGKKIVAKEANAHSSD